MFTDKLFPLSIKMTKVRSKSSHPTATLTMSAFLVSESFGPWIFLTETGIKNNKKKLFLTSCIHVFSWSRRNSKISWKIKPLRDRNVREKMSVFLEQKQSKCAKHKGNRKGHFPEGYPPCRHSRLAEPSGMSASQSWRSGWRIIQASCWCWSMHMFKPLPVNLLQQIHIPLESCGCSTPFYTTQSELFY